MAVCVTAALGLSRWSRIKSWQSLLSRRPQSVITHTHIRPVWEHAAYPPRLVECGITFHVAMILRAVLSFSSQATAPISQTSSFPEYLHGQRLCFLFCGHVPSVTNHRSVCGRQSQSEGEVMEPWREWHGEQPIKIKLFVSGWTQYSNQ